MKRLVCPCGWSGPALDVLEAKDPFNKGETLHACPKCRRQSVEACCDAEGCTSVATMGFPTPDGYRWTCWKHYRPSLTNQTNLTT